MSLGSKIGNQSPRKLKSPKAQVRGEILCDNLDVDENYVPSAMQLF